MKTPNRRPWLFVLLTVLILLAGGMAVGMAARLVVVPQADETVEVDTPTPPSFVSQSVDEVVFYPWNQYDPEYLAANAPALHEYFMDWCMDSLLHGADLLRVTLPEGWDTREPLVSSDTFYWKDIPVTDQQSSQPALLDVGGGYSTQDFGLSIVARSTGEPPTRAQKEAALNQVQQDVCDLFDPQGGQGELYDTLLMLWGHLDTYQVDNNHFVTWEGHGLDVAQIVYAPMADIAAAQDGTGQTTQQRLSALSQTAQSLDYHIQLVTTQRQVVVVLTQAYPTTGDWYSVGVYYDAGLGAYSGVVLNSHVN